MNRKKVFQNVFKPRYFVLPIILAGVVYGNQFADAADPNEKPVEVDYSKNSLTLKINEEGDHYEIYENGKVVYKGTNSSFKDKNITDGHKYKVGIFENNKIKDVIAIKTNKGITPRKRKQETTESLKNTDISESIMKKSVHNAYLQTLSTPNSISISWSSLPDSNRVYEIYRNGHRIGRTNKLSFEDKNVTGGARYRYEVIAKLKVDNATKLKIINELKERNIKITPQLKDELFYIDGVLSKVVDAPKNTKQSLKSKPTIFKKETTNKTLSAFSFPVSEEYSFEYMTFIPQKSVPDPYSPGNWLMGDNRGFNPLSSKYRTSSTVNVGFWMPYMTHFKDVGTSHRCDTSSCENIIKEDTASTDGLQIHKDIVTTTKMRWRINHDIGLPFNSLYPNINYYYDAVLTKSGITVIGSHDKAPSHEFYMLSPANSEAIVIERYMVDSNWDFAMLIPGAPQTVFQFSM